MHAIFCLISFIIQLGVSSIENARQVARSHPHLSSTGVFVGRKTYKELDADDLAYVCQLSLEDCPEEQVQVAAHFHSIFMPNHTHNGLLYRPGEYVFVNYRNCTQTVVRINNTYAIQSASACYKLIKGEIYPTKKTSSGETQRHLHSGSELVVPSGNRIIVSTDNLMRKVMLYPDPENVADPSHYVVVDYLRPVIPLAAADVLIPYYPEEKEMVLVTGDNGNELWLGHIQNVNQRNHTCQLHFYVQTQSGSHFYRRERAGLRSLESVHWRSIIAKANGHWCGRQWKLIN